MKLTLFILSIFVFTFGCSNSSRYYFYKLNTNVINKGIKNTISSVRYISYGKYLFEFKDILSNSSEMKDGKIVLGKSIIVNSGVYMIIDNGKKTFYEYDTFSTNNKLIKKGDLADKNNGTDFEFKNEKIDSNLQYKELAKIDRNNMLYYEAEIGQKNVNNDDIDIIKILLVNYPDFNSIYKINGIKYLDTAYTVLGFNIKNSNRTEEFSNELDSLRLLNRQEIKICEDLIRKGKSF